MGTQSSDFSLITRQLHRTAPPTVIPADQRQCADAEHDLSDGGGKGFMLFLLALVVSALAWWAI